MDIVKTENLEFDYIRRGDNGEVNDVVTALEDVNISVLPGQFIAILGSNGSGKSTLARHLNALLMPTEGTVYVDGKDTRNESNHLAIRKSTGMVFQNPDNQIVGNTALEDVGFGPENLGVPTDEIWERVLDALDRVGMNAYREYSPHKLSGGQKQRIAIAGVLAMKPKCIVLDEPTAMLDPSGRAEVIDAVTELNRKENITVILITHHVEEAVNADKIFVMDAGKVAMEGSPRKIFSQVHRLHKLGLKAPLATELAYRLNKDGYQVNPDIITKEELVEEICRLY